MKVLHICLASFYIDNYSYQENMLPKYHKELGYDVEIIASLVSFDDNGKPNLLKNATSYINEHSIPVTRLSYKNGFTSKRLRKYKGTLNAIKNAKPDIIFIHGCQFLDIKYIVKYIKENRSVKVYVDNHADFSNSATNWLSKNVLHKKIWRYCAQLINPYTHKFYGVLPARVDFLIDIYKLPKQKVDLLVMGADDNIVKKVKKGNSKSELRERYNIKEDDFLIITGGKIDEAKRQIFNLITAVKKIDGIKLIIFGSVIKEMETEFMKEIRHPNIIYVGWINNEETYFYLSSADLAIYPGRHSVYWEQTVGMGIPILVKYWEGTTHIDVGGNCRFLYEDSSNEIYKQILDLIFDKEKYNEMLKIANNRGILSFSYTTIAKKSLDLY